MSKTNPLREALSELLSALRKGSWEDPTGDGIYCAFKRAERLLAEPETESCAAKSEVLAWMYEHDGMVHDRMNPPVTSAFPQLALQNEPWNETALVALSNLQETRAELAHTQELLGRLTHRAADLFQGITGEDLARWPVSMAARYVKLRAAFEAQTDKNYPAHVTRLTAENARLQALYDESEKTAVFWMQDRDALKAEVERLQSESFESLYNSAIDERDAAQAELTKARELLGYTASFSGPTVDELEQARAYLAHQSAPAAWKSDTDSRPEERGTVQCDVPPNGWSCSRDKGHEGPCAASLVAHDETQILLSADLIAVNRKAVQSLLEALTGPAHLIREMQVTRRLPGGNNPIDSLLDSLSKADS